MSILIDPAAPDGFVVNSFAGDDPIRCKDHIREQVNLPEWKPRNGLGDLTAVPARPRVAAEYVYRQANGTPYLRVQRREPKGFPQSHWDGQRWSWKKPTGPKIPYRLPEMLGAVHDTVFVVEGEKDADALTALGFIATTNSEGAGKWTADLNQWFEGKTVYVLADNDEAGRNHASEVARNLYGIADEVRVVELPGLPAKGDVSDWLSAGNDPSDLVDIAHAAPVWTPDDVQTDPDQAPAATIAATPFLWINPFLIPPRQWVYGHHYVRQFLSVTVAPGGVGKSSLGIVEALAMASGKPLLGIQPAERARVWLWNGEDPLQELQRRVMAAAQHYGLTAQDIEGWLFLDSGRTTEIVVAEQTRSGIAINAPVREALLHTIRANSIDVVMIDPFVSSHRVTENDNNAIDQVAKVYSGIADQTNSAIDLVHHARKTGGAEVTMEDGRGAVALLSAARSGRVLNSMTPEEATKWGVEAPRLHFRVDNGKANLAPPPDKATWHRLTSVMLGNGDNVAVVTSWTIPNPFDGVTPSDLRAAQGEVAATGPWRHDPQAREWVGKPIARALKLNIENPIDKAKVKGLLRAWIDTGMFSTIEGKDGKGNPRQFVEVGEWATD